ncbi:hypothetical protein FA95DRAFT_1552334 [Auriscalpium vulgare]|uniref:Uncharacterized protein n=1 Tax=Auriscalpium vulgare TaxID=40419 RepID=A0ACB8SBI4_9AGAM|nr:hypothetical protein FA95DRAFT_1552334 [Auriscalpium vulgare]
MRVLYTAGDGGPVTTGGAASGGCAAAGDAAALPSTQPRRSGRVTRAYAAHGAVLVGARRGFRYSILIDIIL